MKINTKHIGLLCASVLHGSLSAAIDGPLVQEDQEELHINELFTEKFVNDLHYLIKRSYRLTHRDDDAYDYATPRKLMADRYGHLHYRDSECHDWFMLKPFTGTHGSSSIGYLPCKHGIEADYPGFAALLQQENMPPVIAVVFRGSQSRSFQPLNGILGPSWLTNFSASKMECPESIHLGKALFHKGFLEKYLSSRLNVMSDVWTLWKKIPKEQREQTRFVITGHSQGAALTAPAALDIAKNLLPKLFKREFNNIETPRLFVYALSGPNSVGNRETKNMINEVIGRDNIIRHNSIFDIVTCVCPGKHYDHWIYNLLFKAFAGVETGYLPVGRLAIDDAQTLFSKGLYYNADWKLLDCVSEIETNWMKFYHDAVLAYRNEYSFLHLFYKGIAAWHLAHGLSEIGGIGNFVSINHYASKTANHISFAKGRKAKAMSITNLDTSEGASFDPRLPECNLNDCLKRGHIHRSITKELADYDSPEQVFIPELSRHQSVGLEDYESEEA